MLFVGKTAPIVPILGFFPFAFSEFAIEERVENVIKLKFLEGVLVSISFLSLDAFLARVIVNVALIWITQSFVGGRDFLEFGFGSLRIVEILVRVVLLGLFPKGFLDLSVSRILFYTKQVVVFHVRRIIRFSSPLSLHLYKQQSTKQDNDLA